MHKINCKGELKNKVLFFSRKQNETIEALIEAAIRNNKTYANNANN